jgi:hypothetical protein
MKTGHKKVVKGRFDLLVSDLHGSRSPAERRASIPSSVDLHESSFMELHVLHVEKFFRSTIDRNNTGT